MSMRITFASALVASETRARAVDFGDSALIHDLEDGRPLCVPLECFPRLRDASAERRRNRRFIGKGNGVRSCIDTFPSSS
jgi:hypothetical protein